MRNRPESSLPAVTVPLRLRRVALAGNPNVGKTTVFNLLTGMHQKVGNYPGVTVERKSGELRGRESAEIIDLPGTYSLSFKSLDEQVAYDVLTGHLSGETVPDVVVCIADATNLERNLYLATQIIDLGLPTVIALNMMDTAEAQGIHLDVKQLSRELGVPVIPMVAARKQGVDELKKAVTGPLPAPGERSWYLPPGAETQVKQLTDVLAEQAPNLAATRRFNEALRALQSDVVLDFWENRSPVFHAAILEAREQLQSQKIPIDQAEIFGRYARLGALVDQVTTYSKDPSERTLSDRIDAVVTHRIWGPALFLLLLAIIFQAVFSWATPLMDLIELGMIQLGGLTRSLLPASAATDLLVDGVIAGVGNVLVFLPQILLLFFFLGLMEDTGYMARSAFIMDRVMNRMGLSGRSVVPLLSSFACAIPGIMAARTIDNHRDRLVTILVAPLMSCSARLPVYTLFISAFIPALPVFGPLDLQGVAMFSMYLLGIVMAFAAAWILKTFVVKGPRSFFVMELPPYRMPQIKLVFWRMIERSKAFVFRAGKIIFAMSVLLWFLASYPEVDLSPELEAQQAQIETDYQATLSTATSAQQIEEAEVRREEAQRAFADAEAGFQIRNSFIGWFGHALKPVMRPLGFDWKMSAGIVSAFAAREVIISTLATIYSVGDADETSLTLREQLQQDRYPDGTPVYTTLVALSLLVFFVLACQCMSTLAIARRETNSLLWPTVMWTYMTLLAYLAALLVYQGGLALGLG